MSIRRLGIVAVLVALTATLLGVASPAGAAPKPRTLTIFVTLTARETIDVGTSGPSVGDIAIGSGDASRTLDGPVIGSYAYNAEVVRVNIPGGRESRSAVLWVTLPGGTIGTSSLISAPQGTPPDTVQEYIVTGGTGKYAGVRGTMTYVPVRTGVHKAVFHFVE